MVEPPRSDVPEVDPARTPDLGEPPLVEDSGRRGRAVRRALLIADLAGLTIAFVLAEAFFDPGNTVDTGGRLNQEGIWIEWLLFFASLPVWIVGASFLGLYQQDEERADHSTADELGRVFVLITIGAFFFTRVGLFTDYVNPDLTKLTVFWALAIAILLIARIVARTVVRRSASYTQSSIILGTGEAAQLVARKIARHPEYGIDLLGFVDSVEESADSGRDLPILGPIESLPGIVQTLGVERVIVAFPDASDAEILAVVSRLREQLGVQIDFVPKFYEIASDRAQIHSVEGLPLIGFPPARASRPARAMKRAIDIVGALICLAVTAPLFAYIAWRIKRSSPGPIFFRQTRLGEHMREFTMLKFRTMRVDTDEDEHREYIKSTMAPAAHPESDGLFKPPRNEAVTDVGRWLRKNSLDELPQLLNVLRGDMSLVGPRPCLAYETDYFAAHHFDRFRVPAGLTGLWQVKARARSSFAEALEMDVAYAHGWSIGLDLLLLARTPLQLFRSKATR